MGRYHLWSPACLGLSVLYNYILILRNLGCFQFGFLLLQEKNVSHSVERSSELRDIENSPSHTTHNIIKEIAESGEKSKGSSSIDLLALHCLH